MHPPDSLAAWLRQQCGIRLNPGANLGAPDQPKWLVLNEADQPIGTAQNLKAGTALIERYIQQELKQRARAATEQFMESIDD